MSIAKETVLACNRDHARIPVQEDRVEFVRGEVEQFADIAEAVRAKLQFDSEPADFLVELRALAGGARP
jgi:hypothetical protein